jgi:hypothetical protein
LEVLFKPKAVLLRCKVLRDIARLLTIRLTRGNLCCPKIGGSMVRLKRLLNWGDWPDLWLRRLKFWLRNQLFESPRESPGPVRLCSDRTRLRLDPVLSGHLAREVVDCSLVGHVDGWA